MAAKPRSPRAPARKASRAAARKPTPTPAEADRGTPAGDAPSAGTRPAVSWFPGHMHKAQQRLRKEIAGVDVVLELRDARLPATTGNPELRRIIGDRPRLLLLNKASLADPAATRDWLAAFEAGGVRALGLDAESRSGLNLIFPPLRELTRGWAERFTRRGMRPPPQRLLIVGMPNVGKSTLINRLIRERRMKTAPMPGVTRGVIWVALRGDMLLMDTPGVMLPRIDDETTAHRLGWIGALPDATLGATELARSLLAHLLPAGAALLARHFALPDAAPAPHDPPEAWLEAVCLRRGHLVGGGTPDLHRGAEALLQDFRAGSLGRHTLERSG